MYFHSLVHGTAQPMFSDGFKKGHLQYLPALPSSTKLLGYLSRHSTFAAGFCFAKASAPHSQGIRRNLDLKRLTLEAEHREATAPDCNHAYPNTFYSSETGLRDSLTTGCCEILLLITITGTALRAISVFPMARASRGLVFWQWLTCLTFFRWFCGRLPAAIFLHGRFQSIDTFQCIFKQLLQL